MKRSKSLEIKKSVINRDESTLEFFSKLKNADIHKNQNFSSILIESRNLLKMKPKEPINLE